MDSSVRPGRELGARARTGVWTMSKLCLNEVGDQVLAECGGGGDDAEGE